MDSFWSSKDDISMKRGPPKKKNNSEATSPYKKCKVSKCHLRFSHISIFKPSEIKLLVAIGNRHDDTISA